MTLARRMDSERKSSPFICLMTKKERTAELLIVHGEKNGEPEGSPFAAELMSRLEG